MKKIDLHVHSSKSDGTLEPKEIISLAKEKNLTAIALTDHDTVDGIDDARQAALDFDIEFIPGIELSTDYQGMEVHILGLFIDDHNDVFLRELRNFQSSRVERNEKMIFLLQKEGFDISIEKLIDVYPDRVLTRAHLGKYLVEHCGVKNMEQVFTKYLGNKCRCYVPREKITVFEAISLIHSAGGLAFFAHPLLCHMNHQRLCRFIEELKQAGLDGMEAIYSTYSKKEQATMEKLARENDLMITGGSDFHGENKPYIQLGTGKGDLMVPYVVLEAMKTKGQV